MGNRASLRTCLAVLLVLASAGASAGRGDPYYITNFDVTDELQRWTIAAGDWQLTNGVFTSASAGPADIATVHTYDVFSGDGENMHSNFSIDVSLVLRSSRSSARAGIVFDFSDPGNYNEVTFSPTGNAQLRTTIGGVATNVASASFAAPGASKWIHVNLIRSNARTTVKVDGVTVFNNAPQQLLAAVPNKIGLIARNARPQFDALDARSAGLADPYIEDFGDGEATGWFVHNGTWSVQSGLYASTAAAHTAISSSPLFDMWDAGLAPFDLAYTFKVRMLNQYANSGNLIGIAWGFGPNDYREAVFSPKGAARLNSVVNGVRTPLASATYAGGGHNVWFEVEVGTDANTVEAKRHVKVNGVTVFENAFDIRSGGPALITHWTLGKFDDVRAAQRFFRPIVTAFSAGFPSGFVPRGTWTVQGGTLRSTGIAQNSTVVSELSWRDIANIDYRARMVNHYGSAGNLVGLIYGYDFNTGRYYEAVFSPTGVAYLNKVFKGTTVRIATAQYIGGGPHQWFDVQLTQRDLRTTVKVNGIPVFQNVLQPDSGRGHIGLVTHWASAEFDDLSFTELAP